MAEIKPSNRAIQRWKEKELSEEINHVFTFKNFRAMKEVKDMDLVDQKALWDKLSQNFFKIFLFLGEFNIKELGIIRMIYRFSEGKDKIDFEVCPIINDRSYKEHLNKYEPIMKVYDEEQMEKDLL